jgi:hypothetical protein
MDIKVEVGPIALDTVIGEHRIVLAEKAKVVEAMKAKAAEVIAEALKAGRGR